MMGFWVRMRVGLLYIMYTVLGICLQEIVGNLGRLLYNVC
jgi:hypothetical protein